MLGFLVGYGDEGVLGHSVQGDNRTGQCWQRRRTSLNVRLSMGSHDSDSLNRRQFLIAAMAFGVATRMQEVEMVSAKDLMSVKRAYFRYVPRIEAGRDFFVDGLLPLIETENWSELKRVAYQVTSDARSGSVKAEYGLDRKVSELQRLLFDPMSIWAQALGEAKKRKLERSLDKLKVSMDVLEMTVDGKEVSKSRLSDEDKALYQGLARGEIAIAAWKNGRDAINEYLDEANAGLSRELRKVSGIPEQLNGYQRRESRPVPYGTF
mmetsp:Transcript_9924/g.20162  ORF Transcript_9924/g.20162 Transcript_9924/m.20162 type:complete len:265 (-) Transcript_9924:2696-3490(-)